MKVEFSFSLFLQQLHLSNKHHADVQADVLFVVKLCF